MWKGFWNLFPLGYFTYGRYFSSYFLPTILFLSHFVLLLPSHQGSQRFWYSLNSLNCSGFFLILEMYIYILEKSHFQACSGIVLEFRIFDERLLRLQHFRLPPVWICHLWENIISVLPNYLFLKIVKMFLKCSGIF